MPVSRRSVLAAGIAAPFVRRAEARVNRVDVVVVGAGAAGIGAGRELQRLGKTFLILEARDRVGGRVFTDTSLGAPFDAGAAYIHFSDRNPWTALARGHGYETQGWSFATPRPTFSAGRPFPADVASASRSAFAWLRRHVDDADEHSPDLSFAALVANAPEMVKAVATARAHFAMGEEPEAVSVVEWQRLWAGNDLVVPGGYGKLVADAALGLPVELSTAAETIRWDGPGVRVETARGTIEAARAIVTIPIGVLQAGGVRFAPALPPATLEAIDGLRMGALTKIALKLDGERLGLSTNTGFIAGEDPRKIMSVDTWTFDRDLLICIVGGDHARQVIAGGEAAAIDYAVSRVTQALGADIRRHVLGGRLAGWWNDPFSRGSYSAAKIGRFSVRDTLAAPIGERIWLAGEAMAGPASVTAGGAMLSGTRAAGEIARLAASD